MKPRGGVSKEGGEGGKVVFRGGQVDAGVQGATCATKGKMKFKCAPEGRAGFRRLVEDFVGGFGGWE